MRNRLVVTAFILYIIGLFCPNTLLDVQTAANSPSSLIEFSDEIDCGPWRSEVRCVPKSKLAWQKKTIDDWKASVYQAVELLPDQILDRIGLMKWNFKIDRLDWATATASVHDDRVTINLLPNYRKPPEWMTWEPLSKDGLNEVERLHIALHEIGHLYSLGVEFTDLYYKVWTACEVLFIPSALHHYPSCPYSEKPIWGSPTLYSTTMGRVEHFADSFAFYVMWPDYLRAYFPKDYAVMKTIFAKEYQSVYPMPRSITTQLMAGAYDTSK